VIYTTNQTDSINMPAQADQESRPVPEWWGATETVLLGAEEH